MQGVYVPEMMPDLTTEKILVMEWVAGSRLRSAGKRRAGVHCRYPGTLLQCCVAMQRQQQQLPGSVVPAAQKRKRKRKEQERKKEQQQHDMPRQTACPAGTEEWCGLHKCISAHWGPVA